MDAIDDIGAVTVSFEIVFYSVMIVVNLLIFSTIVKMENTENYTVIIASLCFSDALVGVNQIITNILLLSNFQRELCHFGFTIADMFLYIFAIVTSQWHTVVLSVDRYLAVQYALTYYSMVTPLRLKLMVLSAWMIGALVTLLGSLISYLQPPCYDHIVARRYGLTVLVLTQFSTVTIINASIYIKLWLVARKHRNQITAVEGQAQHNTSSSSRKATVIVFIIVAVSALLWTPYGVSIFLFRTLKGGDLISMFPCHQPESGVDRCIDNGHGG